MKSFFTRIQTQQKGLPQNAIFALLLPVFLFSAIQLNAQAPSQVYQEWMSYEDEDRFIDYSVRVVACGANDYILIQVFNEEGFAQQAVFQMTVTDPGSGDNFTYSYSAQAPAASIEEPDCSMGNPDLMVPLPAGYDPNTITLSFSYN